VVTQKNNVPITLASLGRAIEGVENARTAGWAGTNNAVLLMVFKQPGANVIQTVDRIRADAAAADQMDSSLDPESSSSANRTTTIRASVRGCSILTVVEHFTGRDVIFAVFAAGSGRRLSPASPCRSRWPAHGDDVPDGLQHR